MGDSLEDVTNYSLDRPYLRRRLDDWEARLNCLYATLGGWLPRGWEAHRGEPLLVHEKMMRLHDVGPRRMPTLELVGENGCGGTVAPLGLWVVPGNGHLDLRLGKDTYRIIDKADSFEKPEWSVSPAYRRDKSEPLSPEWLDRILR